MALLVLCGATSSAPVSGQSFSEFPVPTARSYPQNIAAGPDGALWFTERDANKIGQITTAGVITEFTVPTASSAPYGMAAGSDGALWFPEEGAGKIGRITTSGAITEFTLPSVGGSHEIASSMTAGPDGALWFIAGAGIGRITTSGAFTKFPIPTDFAISANIAAGPDGALWFTEAVGNKIGRITTAGVVTEFPLPTAGSSPNAIAPGPDSALWFTESGSGGNRIGRITTAGVITEFPIPTATSFPVGIAAGPDGALWFTELLGNKIGRITTAGVITEFAVPSAFAGPSGIAAGPDGALWFTESAVAGVPRIGRLTTSGGGPAFTISKSAPASVVSGQNLTYTLTYGNTGTENATGVVINDTVPTGTTFVSATGGGTVAAGVVGWTIGSVNAGVTGQTVSFTVAVTAASGSVTNSTYSILASGVSAVAGSPVATTVTPAGTPALTISKTAPSSVLTGQNLTYTITYGNTGSASASGVVLHDTVPSGTTFVSATGGGTAAAGIVSWNIGGVSAGVTGQTVSFTVAVTAASGSVNNSSYSILANGVSAVAGSPVATTVTPAGPSTQTTVGNTVANPNASDAFLFPTPYTDVDLVSPATFAGNLTTATFGWSSVGCVQALKIKFFRPSGQNLVFLAERGPFDSFPTTVTLSPPVQIQTGDLIGISHLTNCGNPVGAFPGAEAGYIAFAGDVAATVALSSGKATANFTLAVQASGVASESPQGIVPVVASIPGVPPALFKTGFQMHNSTASTLAGRLVFHPQGVAGSGADPSLAYSLAAGQTQSFEDLPPAMGLAGPRIGSLDIVTPIGDPAPVVAARVFNDGGAGGTTGFTMSAASPDSILEAGDRGVIFTPADIGRFRMNIGVRTGPSGAAMIVTRRSAAGAVLQTLTKTYAPNFFEQISGAEFLATAPFGANDSITIQVTSGSAIVYGVTADNTTQDPSIQLATKAP
jgi:uncharacterized repeat protein (TIGR01451 family)